MNKFVPLPTCDQKKKILFSVLQSEKFKKERKETKGGISKLEEPQFSSKFKIVLGIAQYDLLALKF